MASQIGSVLGTAGEVRRIAAEIVRFPVAQ